MKSLFIVTTWLATTCTTLLISLWAYSMITSAQEGGVLLRQKALRFGGQAQVLGTSNVNKPRLAYAALPNIVSELKTTIKTQDARPVIIENYFRRYNSPMIGNGGYIVKKADDLGSAHHIDSTYLAYLTIAIAQNESNLGKLMPPDCYNAWGYGIHSKGTLCFSNWQEGIDTMMTGVATDYIAKRGLDTPEEMMTRYTPQSPNGAWAKAINQFLDDLYTGTL